MHTKQVSVKRMRIAAVVVLAAGLLALLVSARGSRGVMSLPYRVETPEGRQRYLRALGWESDPATETAETVTLPEQFDATLEDYNVLQRQQGFDLAPYLGKTVTVVTCEGHAPDGGAVLLTLWIHDGVVIAGDAHTAALDGWMAPIVNG